MTARAAVGSAVLGIALAACTPGAGAQEDTTVATPPTFYPGELPPLLGDVDLNPGWELLAVPAMAGRIWQPSVWTGDQLIAWGGIEPDNRGAFADGGVYDAVTNSWRPMAVSPLSARGEHVAVWTDAGLFIWGGHGGTVTPGFTVAEPLGDGALYDPDADSWTSVAPAPMKGGPGYSAVWTGAEVLAYGGSDGFVQTGVHNGFQDFAAYDPASNAWRQPPRPPSDVSYHGSVWTGEEMVIVGSPAYLEPVEVWAYHPATDGWRSLGPSPLPRTVPAVTLVGRRVVVWSYDPEDEGGAVYDLDGEAWTPITPKPGSATEDIPLSVAIGADRVLVATETGVDIYDFTSGAWTAVPEATPTGLWLGGNPLWDGSRILSLSPGISPGAANAAAGIPATFLAYTPPPAGR